MSLGSKLIGFGIAASVMVPASPADAQYQQSRSQRVADEIARTIRDTAAAVGTVQEALYESVNGIRYQGPERFAIERCAPQVQRYGRMRVEEVRPYKRRSWRVYGTVSSDGGYLGRSRGYDYRSFKCTVSDSGRVKVKTKRIRY
jgi:hypothetical protein